MFFNLAFNSKILAGNFWNSQNDHLSKRLVTGNVNRPMAKETMLNLRCFWLKIECVLLVAAMLTWMMHKISCSVSVMYIKFQNVFHVFISVFYLFYFWYLLVNRLYHNSSLFSLIPPIRLGFNKIFSSSQLHIQN